MKRSYLFLLCLSLISFSFTLAHASTYEFYHTAVRDFNGNGTIDGPDHVRVGWTMHDTGSGIPAEMSVVWTGSDGSDHTIDFCRPDRYKESWKAGDTSFEDGVYYRAKIDDVSINRVQIFGDMGARVGDEYVKVDYAMRAYNGPDMNSLSWEKQGDQWLFSWDAPGTWNPDSEYRFTLSNFGDPNTIGNWDITRKFVNGDTSVMIADALFQEAGGSGIAWAVGFQERFANPEDFDNANWLRSYSPTGGEFVPTPIPAAVWLFGSGLLGLVGIRCRLSDTAGRHRSSLP